MKTEYTAILMSKVKLVKGGYMFRAKKAINGNLIEGSFYDETMKLVTPITSRDMVKNNLKEGIYYVVNNKVLIDRFRTLDEGQKQLLELVKAQLLVGFDFPDFNKIGLTSLNLNEEYSLMYNEELIKQNPELYKKFKEKEIRIGQQVQNEDYQEFIEFIADNLELILEEENIEEMQEGILDLNDCVKDFINEYFNNDEEIVEEEKALVKQKEEKNTRESKFKDMIDNDDPYRYKKIKNELDKFVIGQEDAKQVVINALKVGEKKTKSTMKVNSVLVGPTGCGKTYIAEKVADITNRPFLVIDATELSLPGLVGTSIEAKLEALVREENFNLESAQSAIVLFDEIDKQASNDAAGMGKNVYNTLLGFLQGKKYTLFNNDHFAKPIEFDTSNMTIISTGSFAKFANKESSGYSNTSMGFVKSKKNKDIEEIVYPTIDGDFLKNAGLPDELVGRINSIAQLVPMSREVMRKILLESTDSPLLKVIKIFKQDNVELAYTDEFIEEIITKSLKMKTGARSLKFIISAAVKEAEYEITTNPNSIEKITLVKETVNNSACFDCTYKTDVKNTNEDLKYKDLRTKLDSFAIGQDKAKKAVILAIKRGENAETKNERIATVLVGPTGCGKSYIAETAARITGKPFISIDATELSLPGLVGTSIESKLEALVESQNYDIEKASKAVIVFDEIDKQSSNKGAGIGESVYHTLLGFMNGKKYILFNNDRRHQPIEFDTSFLTIIATGSFADYVKEKNGNKNRKPMGFNNNVEVLEKKSEDIVYPEINTEFLKQAGLPNELVGRIESVEQLSPMTEEIMKKILLESSDSPLNDYKELFEMEGVTLRFTTGYIDAIVKEALRLKTGARSLKYVVTKSIERVAFELSMHPFEYKAIILTEKTVKDNTEFQLIDSRIEERKEVMVIKDEPKALVLRK
ncbi:MAG: AAA family ATPase [Bacilli bacterium]